MSTGAARMPRIISKWVDDWSGRESPEIGAEFALPEPGMRIRGRIKYTKGGEGDVVSGPIASLDVRLLSVVDASGQEYFLANPEEKYAKWLFLVNPNLHSHVANITAI